VSGATEQPDRAYDVVAIASSAGGINALSRLLAELPGDFPVPVLIVQHLDPRHRTMIADVVGRRAALDVKLAEAGERIVSGVAYIAPPGRHLLVEDGGRLSLTTSEPVHFVRPSADLLFESIAGAFADRAIACVLTGAGSDGATGVTAVHTRGGTVIAQDPETAEFTGMPESAVATGHVDFKVPLDEIAAVIVGLVHGRRSA
jgi:two-component system, chemotaxis family, protein-glutamate methylesterase/glutaminase